MYSAITLCKESYDLADVVKTSTNAKIEIGKHL